MITDAASKLAVLVTFTWGATPSITRYTSWDQDITTHGHTWTAEPYMSVQCEAQHGGIKDALFNITMRALSPLDKMIRPYAHAPVKVEIAEVDPTDGTTYREVFAGTIRKTVANAEGKRDLVKCVVSGWKSLLVNPLGMNTTARCQWTLGDKNCCVDVPSRRRECQIVGVTKNVISTINSDPFTQFAEYENFWDFGYVTVDGLSIQILKGEPPVFALRRLPPPEWTGAVGLFSPGCDKTLFTCRTRWNNEDRFGGFGILIPKHDPRYEDGADE